MKADIENEKQRVKELEMELDLFRNKIEAKGDDTSQVWLFHKFLPYLLNHQRRSLFHLQI